MVFVHDDGGREAAGFRGSAGDCVTRAIAIATERPYQQVYNELHGLMGSLPSTPARKRAWSPRSGVPRCVYDPYLKLIGWVWTPTMAIGQGCTVHLRDDELPGGRLIVRVTRHMCAVIDGVVHDTHDPSRSGTRCVYGYWHAAVE